MSYKAPPYTLQPGQRVTVQVMGREVAVIEADKDFLIATNDGEPEFITAGLQLSPEGGFHNIVMRNPHPEAINVRLGITDGAIKDNRASVSTVLPVRDPNDLSSFSDVIVALGDVTAQNAAILAMLQNKTDQRRGLTDLAGCSFASQSGALGTVEVVSAAANVSGIRVAMAIAKGVGSVTANVLAGGNSIAHGADSLAEEVRDIVIPSGQALALYSNSTAAYCRVFYEVL